MIPGRGTILESSGLLNALHLCCSYFAVADISINNHTSIFLAGIRYTICVLRLVNLVYALQRQSSELCGFSE